MTAIYTLYELDPLGLFGGRSLIDLVIDWQEEGDYLAEVDLGRIPTNDITDLAGAVWDDLDGITAGGSHTFSLIRQAVTQGIAARVRFIGSFGQRGPWAYTLYTLDSSLRIVSFEADNTEIESGDTVTLTWEMDNATSASIDQGVGALSASQLESGSTTVNPTATITYTLDRYGRGFPSHENGERDGNRWNATLAQPSISSFAPDDSIRSPRLRPQRSGGRWPMWSVERSPEQG